MGYFCALWHCWRSRFRYAGVADHGDLNEIP